MQGHVVPFKGIQPKYPRTSKYNFFMKILSRTYKLNKYKYNIIYLYLIVICNTI